MRIFFFSDRLEDTIVRDTLAKRVVQKIWELSNMFPSQKSSLFTTAAAGASIGGVWEFGLLLPSSRRRLAPDNRQVTVWSPYRRLTFNETHLRPVCSCLLTQCASQAQSLRRQVFYGQYMAVKSALKERKCHKASMRMRMRMSHTASVQECDWNVFGG